MALNVMRMGGAGGIPMYQPGLGMTPTLEGLQAADAAFASATLTGTTVVILIHDPCASPESGLTPASVALPLDAVG